MRGGEGRELYGGDTSLDDSAPIFFAPALANESKPIRCVIFDEITTNRVPEGVQMQNYIAESIHITAVQLSYAEVRRRLLQEFGQRTIRSCDGVQIEMILSNLQLILQWRQEDLETEPNEARRIGRVIETDPSTCIESVGTDIELVHIPRCKSAK